MAIAERRGELIEKSFVSRQAQYIFITLRQAILNFPTRYARPRRLQDEHQAKAVLTKARSILTELANFPKKPSIPTGLRASMATTATRKSPATSERPGDQEREGEGKRRKQRPRQCEAACQEEGNRLTLLARAQSLQAIRAGRLKLQRTDPHLYAAAIPLSGSNNSEEAIKAALRKSSWGIASKVTAPISTVRHSDSPQTEQQRVLPTLAPSHCSMGLPPIQMRLDSEGLALNDASSMSLISRTGSMPRGRSASLSLLMACCIS